MLLHHLALALANLFTISVARPTWSWDVVPSCERLSQPSTQPAALLLLLLLLLLHMLTGPGRRCRRRLTATDWLAAAGPLLRLTGYRRMLARMQTSTART
jgi:hypothetical protein